ncbi:NAD-dependent epimerase/dehydratase family protein [Geosporobacter ferrireducens]|nr:NAD-dependent epimerase/dehydratase family protein [Geosporobacter ferrireducens]
MSIKCFVTGGNGFIGSHFVEYLTSLNNYNITVYDNFANAENKLSAIKNDNLQIIDGDLNDEEKLKDSIKGTDVVFHLAAYSDTKASMSARELTINNGFIATKNLLEAMVENKVKNIVFTSSQLVYGETKNNIIISEEHGPLLPVSIFGASKLSCEALISAYTYLFNINSVICRLSNIIGGRMSRGIIFDFVNNLKNDYSCLKILGNGCQERSYLLIDDCVKAIHKAYLSNGSKQCCVLNIANKDTISARRIAEIAIEEMGYKNITHIETSDDDYGWKGDVPRLMLDIRKIQECDWLPNINSEGAVRETIRRILA